MPTSFHLSARLRALLVAILIVAMVNSHWQGLAHRIGHASRVLNGADLIAQMSGVAALALDDEVSAPSTRYDHPSANHSCLAFDAATVGACLGTSPFVIAVPPHAPVLAAWLAFISYQAPFTAHFSSRAPPQS